MTQLFRVDESNFLFVWIWLQNHKDNHKNSMAGTTVIINVKKGDEVFCKKV